MLVTRYLPICHSPADLLDPFHPEPFHLFSLTKFPFVIGSSRDRYILTMSAQTGYAIGFHALSSLVASMSRGVCLRDVGRSPDRLWLYHLRSLEVAACSRDLSRDRTPSCP